MTFPDFRLFSGLPGLFRLSAWYVGMFCQILLCHQILKSLFYYLSQCFSRAIIKIKLFLKNPVKKKNF